MQNSGRIAPWEGKIMFGSISVVARSVATKQSGYPLCRAMDCFASLAMTWISASYWIPRMGGV
jgi:hypothetical protein